MKFGCNGMLILETKILNVASQYVHIHCRDKGDSIVVVHGSLNAAKYRLFWDQPYKLVP